MNQDDSRKINNDGEISFEDLKVKIKSAIRYIKSKWRTILIVSILGALLGLGYSILKKPIYTAVCTFVLEDSKSGGGLEQYAGLASLAGINVGGSSGGGIFQGDNILELYKSRSMIEQSLLSNGNFDGKKQLLIDRYIDSYHLRNKWKDDSQLSHLNFNGKPDNFSRSQDSIITDLVELFDESTLNVNKLDKKLNIIKVEVATKDELFSKFFTEKLVQNVNDFYVQTKTKKELQNVQILQHQADSVKLMLNYSIHGVASAIEADPNANPLMFTLKETSQKRQVDVQANTAIYSEIVKNLELAKISLRQETPLIQVIDKPVLPLHKNKVGKIKGILVGMILGFIFALVFLVTKRIFQKL
jgi:hypothetical protein